MKPYQERVFDEKTALNEKIVKLVGFVYSDKFGAVAKQERDLLVKQMYIMMDYGRVLEERLEVFLREVKDVGKI